MTRVGSCGRCCTDQATGMGRARQAASVCTVDVLFALFEIYGGLLDRALISSHYLESLDAIRAVEPDVKLGWSVPRVRRDYTQSPLYIVPALIALAAMRRAIPRRAARAIAAGRIDALMAHWRLVTPRLVRAVHGAGGEIYVWTVDEGPAIRRLEELGVDGVITNDPRLFAP